LILLGQDTIAAADKVLGGVMGPQYNVKIDIREACKQMTYSDLMLSIKTSTRHRRIVLNIVKHSKTSQYPDGNTVVAWQGLQKKFAPTTALTLTRLSKSFYGANHNNKVDPEVFITYLKDIWILLKMMHLTMIDEEFIVHILNNLPSEYHNQVKIL
jgi:hypothetical protein